MEFGDSFLFDETTPAGILSKHYGDIGYKNKDKRSVGDEEYQEAVDFFYSGMSLVDDTGEVKVMRRVTPYGNQIVISTDGSMSVLGTWGVRQVWHEYKEGKFIQL